MEPRIFKVSDGSFNIVGNIPLAYGYSLTYDPVTQIHYALGPFGLYSRPRYIGLRNFDPINPSIGRHYHCWGMNNYLNELTNQRSQIT